MALNPDEMNRRRERREAQRRQQEKERRRLKLTLIAACVVLALSAFAIVSIARGAAQAKQETLSASVPEAENTTAAPETTAATESSKRSEPANTVIHLRAAGDLNVTNAVIQSGLAVNGYDFTDALLDVAAELSCGDVTVLNLEGNICGEPYGTDTTSAPRELATALKNAGVDLVQMANTYTVKNGIIGLTQTLQQLRSAGIEPLGAYASNQDFKTTKGYTICNVGGIKVAFVAFTKGLGGMGLPAGNENCVNLLYTDYNDVYNKVDTKGITAILDNVAAEKPDVIVVVAYGKILPASLLALPPFGAVNVHGSLLPRYRGAAPIQWAVLNGDAVAGVTTMQMDAGIDTGDMLLTCSRPVPQDMTAGELFDLLSADGAGLLCETLESMQNGTLHPQKQDGDAASYAPMLDKTMSPLDFQKSAKSLHDQVRGLQPWPTATCRFGDAVLKIHKTRVGGHTTEDAGVIVSLSPLSVACGDGGVLEILELQYPGSRRMAAADFLRGHPLCCGDRLH